MSCLKLKCGSVDPSGQKEEDVESDLSTRGVQRPAAEDRRKQDRIDELESECESDVEPDIERSKELVFIEYFSIFIFKCFSFVGRR